jgi:hypothetical protein
MDKGISISLRLQILFASYLLRLEHATSYLLTRISYSLRFYLVSMRSPVYFANLSLFSYIIPIIVVVTTPLWMPSKPRKGSRDTLTRRETVDGVVSLLLWLAIILVLHRESSPLYSRHLANFLDFFYRSYMLSISLQAFLLTDYVGQLASAYFGKALMQVRRLHTRTAPSVNLLLLDLLGATGHVISPLITRSVIGTFLVRLNRFLIISTGKYFLPAEVTNTPYFTAKWHWATSIPSDYFFCLLYNLWSRGNQRKATMGEIPTQKQNSVDFMYTTIGKDTIRLLLIYPRPPKGPLNCALFPVQLSSAPHYEAISYCWGSDEKNSEIIVNDCSLKITSNALRVLKNRSSL